MNSYDFLVSLFSDYLDGFSLYSPLHLFLPSPRLLRLVPSPHQSSTVAACQRRLDNPTINDTRVQYKHKKKPTTTP